MKKIFLKNLIHGGLAAAFLLGVWLIAYFATGNELLVPSPIDCVREMGALFRGVGFWRGFFATLGRAFAAFGVSFVLAAIFAVIAYLVPSFGRILSPIASALRSLPVLAVLLILLIWWGAAYAPVAVAFLSLFPMLYAGISAALSQVDGELVEMSRIYRVPLKKRIFELYLPSAAPYVLRESGAALSFSLKLVVSAEVIARTAKSLGGLMDEARAYQEIPTLFALVLVTFAAAILMEGLVGLVVLGVERRVK